MRKTKPVKGGESSSRRGAPLTGFGFRIIITRFRGNVFSELSGPKAAPHFLFFLFFYSIKEMSKQPSLHRSSLLGRELSKFQLGADRPRSIGQAGGSVPAFRDALKRPSIWK